MWAREAEHYSQGKDLYMKARITTLALLALLATATGASALTVVATGSSTLINTPAVCKVTDFRSPPASCMDPLAGNFSGFDAAGAIVLSPSDSVVIPWISASTPNVRQFWAYGFVGGNGSLMEVYDGGGYTMGTFSFTGTPGWQQLLITADLGDPDLGGFAYIQSARSAGMMTGVGVGWAPDSGAVPEPASWALMIAGFGMVGTMARRRRSNFRTA